MFGSGVGKRGWHVGRGGEGLVLWLRVECLFLLQLLGGGGESCSSLVVLTLGTDGMEGMPAT